MPRELDRLLIEAALSAEGRAFLAEQCRVREVSRRHWLENAELRPFFVSAALYGLREHLEVDEGLSPRVALRRAAQELGMDPDNVERSDFRRKAKRREPDRVSHLAGGKAA